MAGDLLVAAPPEPQRQRQIVERAQMVEQAEILEHHADTPAQELRSRPGRAGRRRGRTALIRPRMAAWVRLSRRRSEVLPAPLGPIRKWKLPAGELQLDVVQHLGAGP